MYEQLAVHNANPNRTAERKKIRTRFLLSAKLKHKHHISQKESNEKQKHSTETRRSTNRWQNHTQQTTSTESICNDIHTSTNTSKKSMTKVRTSSCAKWNFKPYNKKNTDTNGVVVVCNLKVQTSY